MKHNLREEFGDIDIYLFDQLLKGRFDNCKSILDVGCGYGRNLHYFLKNGYEVFGVDENADAIENVKALAHQLAPTIPVENFVTCAIEAMPFNDNSFDVVISSAVFHFANDHNHFEQMLRSCWRVLKPGGFLFARLASDIGIEDLVVDLGNGRFALPEGSQRYLVNQEKLKHYTIELKGELFEPIKTTNVQNLRCMTTWCMQKK